MIRQILPAILTFKLRAIRASFTLDTSLKIFLSAVHSRKMYQRKLWSSVKTSTFAKRNVREKLRAQSVKSKPGLDKENYRDSSVRTVYIS